MKNTPNTSPETPKKQLPPELQKLREEGHAALQAKIKAGIPRTHADFEFVRKLRAYLDPLNALERMRKLMDPEKQHGERIETLRHFGFLDKSGKAKKGDTPMPTPDKVMAAFTPEELEIAATFQAPTLLLVPDTSFDAKVKAIDAHKNKGQKDTYQADLYKKSDSGSEKITGWKACIVDGAKEMDLKPGDDVKLRFDKRIENRKAARKPGERGMERHSYALLMMESLRKGEPIDQWNGGKGTYTLLDDDPALSDSAVPYAYWYDVLSQVNFSAYVPGYDCGYARLRSAVGGVVEL